MVSSGTAYRPLKQIDAINWKRNSPTKRAKESQDELSSVELSALSWADNFMRTTPFDWWDLCSLLPLRIVFYFYLVVLPFFALSAAFVWAPFPEPQKQTETETETFKAAQGQFVFSFSSSSSVSCFPALPFSCFCFFFLSSRVCCAIWESKSSGLTVTGRT